MKPFREKAPNRTYKNHHSRYQDYKPFLAKDFNHKCGYTNCSDSWFGGKNNFHIDHFIPWKKHPDKPQLKTDYENLVYSCSYVNILKSDKEGEFIDPCNEDYNKHFERDDNGTIIPISSMAKLMYKNMKLFLERYRIIWTLDQLEQRIDKLQKIIEKTDNKEAKNLYIKLSFEYHSFRKYLMQIDE